VLGGKDGVVALLRSPIPSYRAFFVLLTIALNACSATGTFGPEAPQLSESTTTMGSHASTVRFTLHDVKCCLAGAIAIDNSGRPWFVTGTGVGEGVGIGRYDGGVNWYSPTNLAGPSGQDYPPLFENALVAVGNGMFAVDGQEASGACCSFTAFELLNANGASNLASAPGSLFTPYWFSSVLDTSTGMLWSAWYQDSAGGVDEIDPNTGNILKTVTFSLPANGLQVAQRSGNDMLYVYGYTHFSGSAIVTVSKSYGSVLHVFPMPKEASIHWYAANPIAEGPDGGVWFVDDGRNAIGHMNARGRFTRVPIPSPSAQPNSIVAGCDGALWFTEQATRKLGRVTVDGNVTEYVTPAHSELLGIAQRAPCTGPTHELWLSSRRSLIRVDY
jgi:streptogramin lyase